MTEAQAQFGVIGMGVMGRNLALNVADHGTPVAIWNRTPEVTDRVVAENPAQKLLGARSLEEFVRVLVRPRKILLLVPAGAAVDQTIERLKPLLADGDILIDGGNTWFEDTRRREAALRGSGIRFFGMGVSGGEEGARRGPSLMPGGDRGAYEHVRPILEAIAARTDSGPCVTYIGPDGAGHFVKMVHNGIEYGDMQLIAEAYDFLRTALGMSAPEIAGVFADWNKWELESFLIEITAKVFQVRDEETGRPLVDLVLDKAGQKGTGKWTVQAALDLGVEIPTISAAVDARVLSSRKDERVIAAQRIRGPGMNPVAGNRSPHVFAVRDALWAAKICSYAQGMTLLRAASERYAWNLHLSDLARIWKGGCIIRARLLDSISRAFERRADLPNLLLDEEFRQAVESAQINWRRALTTAVTMGVPTPALSASLAWFDAYRTANLPQNLTQAQRDAFGAHTYQRADRPEAGFVHTDWLA